MATYWCMCVITGDVPAPGITEKGWGPLDGQVYQAPNRYGPIQEGARGRAVYLGRRMQAAVVGAEQFVCLDEPGGKPPANTWPQSQQAMEEDLRRLMVRKQHHPNVDIYRCPHCGAEIIVER